MIYNNPRDRWLRERERERDSACFIRETSEGRLMINLRAFVSY